MRKSLIIRQRNLSTWPLIKLGMDTKSVIARFEAERQALALMDHPNIAQVHDAGTTETGRPYFVMELVRGPAITAYCDEKNLSTQTGGAELRDKKKTVHFYSVTSSAMLPSTVCLRQGNAMSTGVKWSSCQRGDGVESFVRPVAQTDVP